MAGILFILIVLAMFVIFALVFWHGRGIVFVDPQPSYYVVEEEDEEEQTPRRAVRYYPPKDHGPLYKEMVDRLGSLG